MSGKCKFRPLRANQKNCIADASVAWGFCKKHTRTVQATEAQKLYDEEVKKKEEQQLRDLEAELDSVQFSESDEEKEEEKEMKEESEEDEDNEEESEEEKVAPRRVTPEKKITKMKKGKEREREKERQRQDEEDSESRLVLRPNAWGRFEDHNTGILFHPETKAAYGLQDVDGSVISLDDEAIKVCVENGWAYIQKIPRENRSRQGKKKETKASKEEEAEVEEEEFVTDSEDY